MKTKIAILVLLISIIAVVTFFSCDNPISLGTKLDLLGPVVTIVSPTQRQSVPVKFDIEGTAQDESVVDMMLITVKDNPNFPDFPRQWRFKTKKWEISDDFGETWSPYPDASWTGDKSVTWKITIDMVINGQLSGEGEITFNIQAWDKGGMSDDNSFKALVLIVDIDPPKVVITNPYLYGETESDFIKFDAMQDSSDEWMDPSYLGKFITQEFSLKWQIEDANDVWSINISFYPSDTYIDNSPDTELPDNYIYRYSKNTPPPPSGANPNDYVRLNGSVTVPDLYGEIGVYDEGGILKNPIPEKTSVKVVAVCYDAAGNPNQEKTLGYFISWPRANSPWIDFSEGIVPPDGFYGRRVSYDENDHNINQDYIEKDVFTVYPGRSVKATAFQSHGVKEVKYSLYKCNISGNTLNSNANNDPGMPPFEVVEIDGVKQINIVRSNTAYGGTYSTIFPWELNVPPITGYYVFTAEAFSSQGKSNEDYNKKYTMLFRVHDITFPDFTEGPFPVATDPLFLDIKNNKITINGVVSDATNVVSLCLVWIDPESKNWAAMSQLSYFRDKDYKGWQKALTLSPGTSALENIGEAYDDAHRNRLWMLNLANANPPIDNETNRHRFSYSQVIDLTDDLNIAADKQPLRSQVFLLRAQNPDGKCTIITYAPQGDTLAPDIKITKVVIPNAADFIPNEYAVVPKFTDGDTITIHGTWREDSLAVLPIDDYFKENFNITINNTIVMDHDKKMLPVLTTNPDKTTGTWSLTVTVKTETTGSGLIALAVLKDTLVIGANVKDIGGNVAETGCSWLIESDNLRLMRISSEKEDGTYAEGTDIDIFLEFSKPVRLTNNDKKPELILNSANGNTARAVYKDGQVNQNSRQYFTYTVGADQTTGTGGWLNIKGIYCDGTEYTMTTPSDPTSGYPFSWSRGALGVDGYEEVRITMESGHGGNSKESGGYYLRTLPTTTVETNPDYQFTLTAGKHIAIDTSAPVIQRIYSNTGRGYYNAGDIYITAYLSKPVGITGIPSLTLQVANGGNATVQTNANAGNVRVNGREITFVYTIKPGDTTNGNAVIVSDFSGTITDLAGNELKTFGIPRPLQDDNSESGDKNIYIETLAPAPPTVRILTAANVGNVISQNVSGVTITGESTQGAVKNLSTVYQDNLWIAVQGNTTGDAATSYKVSSLEYSINNGLSWVTLNTTNTPVQLTTQTGNCQILARQTDKAGNVSANTSAVNFNWDPGTLVTRISSTNANGTYTHVTGRDQIAFTVYFRKNLYIATTTTPQITLQNVRTYNNAPVNVTIPSIPGGAVNSLTFTYTVGYDTASGTGDYMSGGTYLDIGVISGITAWDGNAVNNGVNVSSLITLPAGSPKLEATKQFDVLTGALTNTAPTWAADSGSETSADFHGIRTDDGSYWTTLEIVFNHAISKGEGTITIQQIAGSENTAYRLPAVMTEAQYNRFKSNANTSGVIDTYYVKGTNGYIDGTGSDTSNKYILQYKWDPRSDVTTADTGFTGNTPIPSEVFTAFRNAEKIELDVNSSVVTIDDKTLKIRLSGSNAPQVPGASYEVTYPAGLVTDSLGNSSATGNYTAANNNAVALHGVAKPFVRIRKTQDTISVATGGPDQPRLVATQPFLANARMDCRTPNSAITYRASTGQTNVQAGTAPTANTQKGSNNWFYNANPDDNTANYPNPPAPDATRPGDATNSTYTNSDQITFGYTTGTTSPDITNVQGFQWWVRARAGVGATYSYETEEMAYRTVISYSIRNLSNRVNQAGGRSNFQDSDQAWIRGGDSIGSSSIPGFPFTWEDNWETLKEKRAGIRLMSLVSTVVLPATGTWTATKDNAATNTYTAANNNWPSNLSSNETVTITVNNNTYTAYIISNTNRTFRIYTYGTNGNGGNDNGTGFGGNSSTINFTMKDLNNSLWRFVTWDMNTTAYIDFIRGRDLSDGTFDASDADVAWQYGPKRWCYQVDGWTAFKERYPIYAGKHRWCDMGTTMGQHGDMNFSGTFAARPDKAVNYTGVNQP